MIQQKVKWAEFYEKVGIEIKRWLSKNKKNGDKPSNNKELAQRLDCSVFQLSRYISGSQEMPQRYVTRLLHLGFAEKYFQDYYLKEQDKLIPEILTKEDMIRLVYEYKVLVEETKNLYGFAWDKVDRYMAQAKETINQNIKLLDEVEKLRALVKELRKELEMLKGKSTD